MRTRLCAYLKTRRKSDWLTLAALYVLLLQLVIGTITVYAQSGYRFSSQNGRFSTEPTAVRQSVETAITVIGIQGEQNSNDIAALRSQLTTLNSSFVSLERRFAMMEQMGAIASKTLSLIYGVVATLIAGLVLAIVNMRLQRKNRREQLSKDDLRELLVEHLKERS